MFRRPPRSTLFPYMTLFRSGVPVRDVEGHVLPEAGELVPSHAVGWVRGGELDGLLSAEHARVDVARRPVGRDEDRKSTRLNSSHEWISYAVFCLKKKILTRRQSFIFFLFHVPAPPEIYTLSLHDALPIWCSCARRGRACPS